ncbi:hypothetical protein IC582_023123 [Cucumis melo]
MDFSLALSLSPLLSHFGLALSPSPSSSTDYLTDLLLLQQVISSSKKLKGIIPLNPHQCSFSF